MVVTAEAWSPVPVLGLPLARSGGQAVAQAPAQALVVPWSALKRYSVRPWPLTRTRPSPVLARASVEALSLPVGAAVSAAPELPPPHPASAAAAIPAAADAVRVMVSFLRWIMLLLLRFWGRFQLGATAGVGKTGGHRP